MMSQIHCKQSIRIEKSGWFKPVILKVGEIAPLGAISKDKGAKKTKGAIGGRKIMKGAKTLIDR